MAAQIPQDLEAESSVLGSMLVNRLTIEPAQEIIGPEDLYKPIHKAIFSAIIDLYEHGEPIDETTVYSKVHADGLASPDLPQLLRSFIVNVPSTTAIRHYCKAVERASVARGIMRAAQDALSAVTEGEDPYAIGDDLTRHLLGIGSVSNEQQAKTIQELIDSADAVSPVIIPGLLTQQDRVIVTARPGTGKSTLLKFLGLCVAHGIHPFVHGSIPAKRVLSVDVENPIANIVMPMTVLRATLEKNSAQFDEENFKVFRRPGGLDIRNRRDRSDLTREIALMRPELVVAGPVYRMAIRRGNESWEQAADEFLEIWDFLRVRYGFSLILEAHSPKSAGKEGGEISPQGSARFSQWSEVGLFLRQDQMNPETLWVDRFRGDRMAGVSWPQKLERDPQWLFRAVWTS